MISKSPAERFIVFLITNPAYKNNDKVIEHCVDLSIPWLSGSYLDRLSRDHAPPKKFAPTNKKHKASQVYLRTEGITELYFPNAATIGAMQLLREPRAREMVEAMMIAAAPASMISRAVARSCNVPYGPEVYEAYERLFWDTASMDTVSLRALLEHQADECQRNADPDVRAQQQAMRRAYRHDPRRLAAALPRTAITGRIVAAKLGIWSPKLNVREITERILEAALLDASRCVLTGTSPRTAGQLMDVARIASELLEGMVDPTEEISKLAAFRIVTEDRRVPLISDLAGERTIDVNPTDRDPHDLS